MVGLHGAALSNMVWMPRGSQVVELTHLGSTHFKDLARMLEHRYLGVPTDPVADRVSGSSSVKVNLDLFCLLLDSALMAAA